MTNKEKVAPSGKHCTLGIYLFVSKVADSVKANMTWTTKNIISSHHFSEKFKTSTNQEHER